MANQSKLGTNTGSCGRFSIDNLSGYFKFNERKKEAIFNIKKLTLTLTFTRDNIFNFYEGKIVISTDNFKILKFYVITDGNKFDLIDFIQTYTKNDIFEKIFVKLLACDIVYMFDEKNKNNVCDEIYFPLLAQLNQNKNLLDRFNKIINAIGIANYLVDD